MVVKILSTVISGIILWLHGTLDVVVFESLMLYCLWFGGSLTVGMMVLCSILRKKVAYEWVVVSAGAILLFFTLIGFYISRNMDLVRFSFIVQPVGLLSIITLGLALCISHYSGKSVRYMMVFFGILAGTLIGLFYFPPGNIITSLCLLGVPVTVTSSISGICALCA